VEIVAYLPDVVYVSFDIDGLTPSACPNTGTSVPGGLTYNDALYLLHQVRDSGKTIVGFDLVEVGSIDYDANIAAHLLYQLCGLVRD
jgi:agmatinase